MYYYELLTSQLPGTPFIQASRLNRRLNTNICELKSIAEEEAAEVTSNVIVALTKLNFLPSSPSEEANTSIIMHYTAATLKQEAIILEYQNIISKLIRLEYS